MTLAVVDGLPKNAKNRNIGARVTEQVKFDNQFVIQGSSPVFPKDYPNNDDEVIVFLEYVQSSGTFTIEGKGTGVLSGAMVSPLDLVESPLRLDGGVKLNGTILFAKGFWLPKH